MFTVILYNHLGRRVRLEKRKRVAEAVQTACDWSIIQGNWASVRRRSGTIVGETVGSTFVFDK